MGFFWLIDVGEQLDWWTDLFKGIEPLRRCLSDSRDTMGVDVVLVNKEIVVLGV